MVVFVLSGRAGVGKTTAGEYLRDTFGARMINFADGVYECAGAIQQIIGAPVIKNRALLQMIGEGLKGIYGQDIWVRRVVEKINSAPDAIWVVGDMRFAVEHEAMKALGANIVRITRAVDRLDHPTESELDHVHFDTVVDNRTMDQFLCDIHAWVAKIISA